MKDNRRIARVEAEIQRTVATHLISRVQGEIGGILTVSRVQTPADLRSARVYVSHFGEKVDWDDVLSRLQEEAPEIQRVISHTLRMRHCPKLQFFKDESTEKVLKVEGLLREIKNTSAAQPQQSGE